MVYTSVPQYLAAVFEPVKYILYAHALISSEPAVLPELSAVLDITNLPKSASSAWKMYSDDEKKIEKNAEETSLSGLELPLLKVRNAFSLNEFENFTLVFSSALEINPVFSAALSLLGERLTLGLLLRLFSSSVEESMKWQTEWLRRSDTLRLIFNGAGLRDTVTVRPSILRFLLGVDLTPDGALLYIPGESLPSALPVKANTNELAVSGVTAVIGKKHSGRKHYIKLYANKTSVPVLFLPYVKINRIQSDEISAVLKLNNALLCVTDVPNITPDDFTTITGMSISGTVFLTSEKTVRYADANINIVQPSFNERLKLWRTYDKKNADFLASQYELPVGKILNIIKSNPGRALPVLTAHCNNAARKPPETSLLIAGRCGLDEAAFPTELQHRLENSIREVKSKKGGYRILITGGSGVGKSLCAQVIATELCKDLYAASLYSHDITELLETSADGGFVVCFDSSDDVFNTYNPNTALLIQQIEDCSGVLIFTATDRTCLITQFTRHMNYRIDF